MFTLCTNGACAMSGWCKRFSYIKKAGPDWPMACFDCNSRSGWPHYVKNKAREIFERDNPREIFNVPEPEQRNDDNHRRESRLREDDMADIEARRACIRRNAAYIDNLLQPFQRSGERGNRQGYEVERLLGEPWDVTDNEERPIPVPDTTFISLSDFGIQSDISDPTATDIQVRRSVRSSDDREHGIITRTGDSAEKFVVTWRPNVSLDWDSGASGDVSERLSGEGETGSQV